MNSIQKGEDWGFLYLGTYRAISARVLLGGKLTGYLGKYPGLAEEALFAIKSRKALFLGGGFGGCTHALIQAVKGETAQELTHPACLGENQFNRFHHLFS